MRRGNVKRILYFHTELRPTPGGGTAKLRLTQQEFSDEFHFEPDGVSVTIGVNQGAVDRFTAARSALSQEHRDVLNDALSSLIQGTLPDRQVIVSLLPLEHLDEPRFDAATSFERAYDFVDNNVPFLDALATELNQLQEQARAADRNRTLRITVRYASEMNDIATPDQPYGRDPNPDKIDHGQQQDRFKASYRLVRARFQQHAPAVPFTFSPAIRTDIRGTQFDVLTKYFPGDDNVVDAISCTYFVGFEEDTDGAIEMMRRYFLQRAGRNLPFAIDEMGGKKNDGPEPQNDVILARMFGALQDLGREGIEFEYVTFYLDDKFGEQATLAFLQG